MAKNIAAPAAIIAAGTSIAAAGTQRGTLDCRTIDRAIITVKVTNGATGPTVQATIKILVAHNTGATPTAAAAGADWKTVRSFGCTVLANKVTEISFTAPPEVQHVQVEIGGHTVQAVTGEAFASTVTYT